MRAIALMLFVAVALTSCADPNAYRVATEQERTEVVAAVRDYYAMRTRLTTDLTIEDFWQIYPDLGRTYDLATGINTELFLSQRSHAADGGRRNYRVDLESYQPIRVFMRNGEALAIVHGIESYGLSTKGEMHVVLTLRQRDGQWTVVRTDEQMMGERPPTDPPVR